MARLPWWEPENSIDDLVENVGMHLNSKQMVEVRKRFEDLKKAQQRLLAGTGDDTLILPDDEPEDQAKAHGQEIIPDPADVDDFEVLHPEDADGH